MNKLMAVLLFLGALGGFGLSRRDSFESREAVRGTPSRGVRIVRITPVARVGYMSLGVVCLVGCLYFVARIRRDDLRR
jgi:hypothetical protein